MCRCGICEGVCMCDSCDNLGHCFEKFHCDDVYDRQNGVEIGGDEDKLEEKNDS